MKINKIICDVCEQEIDVEKDIALAMFEYIQARPTISFDSNPISPNSQMKAEKEIVKTSYDLCKNCADILVEVIEEKKKEIKKVEKSKNKEEK